jgi:iron-sulfur cluster assembly protein
MYTVGLAEIVEPEDQIFESHGIKIFVNTSNLIYLEGIEVDYVKQGIKEGFCFNNPNAKEKCGCGESFSITSVG